MLRPVGRGEWLPEEQKANASRHAAVSYKRAGGMIEQLELEVEELMAKAERADNTPLEDGLTLPEEIVRRQDRQAKSRRLCSRSQAEASVRDA